MQEAPETGKITQLIKLAVRKPSAKCRDTLPTPAVVVQLGPTREERQHPGLRSAASGGIQGKDHQSPCRAAAAPHAAFLGSSQIPTWRKQSTTGCLLHPHPQAPWNRYPKPGMPCCLGSQLGARGDAGTSTCTLWGEGLGVPCCGLSPVGLTEGPQPMDRSGRPSQSLPCGSLLFNTFLLVGLPV